MDVLIGVDIGTHSTKAVALEVGGRRLGEASCSHGIEIPQAGYCEQDAEQVWWQGFVTVVKELLKQGSFQPEEVRSIGVSTLSPCVLAVDEQGNPLRKAILYGVDVRAARQIARFNQELGLETVLRRYGQPMSSQTAGPKILWLKENDPEVFEHAAGFVPATSYMVHRLTGRWTLDQYVAPSYAPFFRIDTMEWDREMIRRYLGRNILESELLWPGETAGTLTEAAGAVLGLPAGIPVMTGSADALAEAVSGAGIRPGYVFIMYGSSIIFIATTREKITSSETFWPSPGMVEGEWALAGGMSTTGSLVDWAIETFFPEGTGYPEFFAAAKESPPGARGLVVLPYFSGERTPISDPKARGVIFGLTLHHSRSDIARAVLEGVAYGIRHNIEEYEKRLGPVKLIGAGGGVTDPFWVQIISDVCGKEHEIMAKTNAATGDALMAGMACGALTRTETEQLARQLGSGGMVYPNPEHHVIYQKLYEIYCSLYTDTKALAHELEAMG